MSKTDAGEPTPRDEKALLSAGGLLLAVAAVLVLGAVLHGRVPAPAAEPVDVPAPSAAAEAPLPSSLPSLSTLSETDDVDGRARRDHARLGDGSDGWTLQLVVACKEEGVRRLLDRVGGDERLFVLPKDVNGRSCWAVTWGTFLSEGEAAAANPPRELQLSEPPRPRPLSAFSP